MPPTTGTFIIRPNFVNVLSGQFDRNSTTDILDTGPSSAAVPVSTPELETYWANPSGTQPRCCRNSDSAFSGFWQPANRVYEVSAFAQHDVIFNGTETIPFIDPTFPLGIRFDAVKMRITGSFFQRGSGNHRFLTLVELKARQTVVHSVVPSGDAALYESAANAIVPTGNFLGANQLFGITMGFALTISETGDLLGPPHDGLLEAITFFQMEGAYNFAWITTSVLPERANPGDTITISDSQNNLDDFTSFQITFERDGELVSVEIPSEYILTHTASTLTLIIPSNLNIPFDEVLWIDGSSSIYSQIGIAQLNADPILVNGSGLYTLVPGKRNDTYYDRSVTPATTIDLQIKSPFGRTGFVK